jgi:hypothetical protein
MALVPAVEQVVPSRQREEGSLPAVEQDGSCRVDTLAWRSLLCMPINYTLDPLELLGCQAPSVSWVPVWALIWGTRTGPRGSRVP